MRRSICFLVLAVVLPSLAGCGEWGGSLPEHVLARVNEEFILVEEFDREFKESILELGKTEREENSGELKQAYLDQMIERKILAQEARRLGIQVSPGELDQVIAEINQDYPSGGFDERLGLKGTTLEEWKGRLEEELLAEKMIRHARRFQGKVEEKEALQYYEANLPTFQVKQRVRARQIVVADGQEALEILKRLRRGEKFEKVAMEKSMGPEKVNGGDLGFFSPGERPPEFDQVFSMEVGTISEVIKSPYGYHIFKLEEKIEPREIPFEEAKAGILQELGRRKAEDAYQKWLKGLREKAKVQINKKWLRS